MRARHDVIAERDLSAVKATARKSAIESPRYRSSSDGADRYAHQLKSAANIADTELTLLSAENDVSATKRIRVGDGLVLTVRPHPRNMRNPTGSKVSR